MGLERFIPLEKRNKKERKEYFKKQRVTSGMNTGVRTLKSNKDYNRKWKVEDYE